VFGDVGGGELILVGAIGVLLLVVARLPPLRRTSAVVPSRAYIDRLLGPLRRSRSVIQADRGEAKRPVEA
jgi:hypothetical protein